MLAIALTPDHNAIIDDEDYDLISKYEWSLWTSGRAKNMFYARCTTERGQSISMHRIILGVSVNVAIDHINHNGLDNRRANLRITNQQKNSWNSKPHNDGVTRYKGIFNQGRNNGKWYSKVTYRGQRYYLGSFNSQEEAALAYDNKVLELFGEFAYLNFPERIHPEITDIADDILKHTNLIEKDTQELRKIMIDAARAFLWSKNHYEPEFYFGNGNNHE